MLLSFRRKVCLAATHFDLWASLSASHISFGPGLLAINGMKLGSMLHSIAARHWLIFSRCPSPWIKDEATVMGLATTPRCVETFITPLSFEGSIYSYFSPFFQKTIHETYEKWLFGILSHRRLDFAAHHLLKSRKLDYLSHFRANLIVFLWGVLWISTHLLIRGCN